MSIEKDIFKKSRVNESKLINYGFKKEKDNYIYSKDIMNNCMRVYISIDKHKNITSKIIDKDFNEEYTAFRNESSNGSFNNKVREEYKEVLNDIKDKCFTEETFIFGQSNRLTKYIKEKYNDSPTFEWETSPGFGIFRNKNTKKWYALVMNINFNKIDNDKKEEIEIVNIKLDEEKILNLLKQDGFYKAWHMNKKYWITIVLNDTIDDKLLFELVDESYNYSSKK